MGSPLFWGTWSERSRQASRVAGRQALRSLVRRASARRTPSSLSWAAERGLLSKVDAPAACGSPRALESGGWEASRRQGTSEEHSDLYPGSAGSSCQDDSVSARALTRTSSSTGSSDPTGLEGLRPGGLRLAGRAPGPGADFGPVPVSAPRRAGSFGSQSGERPSPGGAGVSSESLRPREQGPLRRGAPLTRVWSSSPIAPATGSRGEVLFGGPSPFGAPLGVASSATSPSGGVRRASGRAVGRVASAARRGGAPRLSFRGDLLLHGRSLRGRGDAVEAEAGHLETLARISVRAGSSLRAPAWSTKGASPWEDLIARRGSTARATRSSDGAATGSGTKTGGDAAIYVRDFPGESDATARERSGLSSAYFARVFASAEVQEKASRVRRHVARCVPAPRATWPRRRP